MALIGLDEIEWDKLSHAYGSAKDIPDLLRALGGAETKEEFESIYRELIVRVNHQGDIYDSTAPTVRFLLQMLDEIEASDKRLIILDHLGSLLGDIQNYPMGFFRNPGEVSVTLLRSNIGTYDAIAGGLKHYLAGIQNKTEDIRYASLYILFHLIEQSEAILPSLVDCVETADDEWFQACTIWSFVNIETYDWYQRRRNYAIEQLNKWLDYDNSLVRYTAAFGKLRLSLDSTKEPIVKTIAEVLKRNVWGTKRSVSGDRLMILIELTPFHNPIRWITNSSSLPYIWIAILQRLEPAPKLAHVCVSEILKLSFTVQNVGDSLPKWTSFDYLDLDSPSIIYKPGVSPEQFNNSRPLTKRQYDVLQIIVDCEPFWEIPTNLFSFFYGLPDDREELRKLVEGK